MQHRMGTIKQVILGFLGLILLLGAVLVPSGSAWAGDINDAEAGVIAVASGTFEYNGKTYRAYSSYINELYARLSKDGVDWTEGQANTAIRYIYNNVAAGLKRGYIYEVGSSKDPNATTEQPTDDTSVTRATEGTEATEATETTENTETTETTQNTGATSSRATSQQVTEATEEDTETDSEVEDVFRKVEESQDNKQVISERVKPEEADAKAIIKEESIVIDTGDDVIELDSNKQIVPPVWPRTLLIVAIVTAVITVAICLILILTRCMRFGKSDRKKPMHGHRRRRRIRKHCRRVLTVTTAVSIAGIFLLLSLFVIVFNNTRILQSVQDSGYFRYAYIEYLSDMGRGEDGHTTEAPTEEGQTTEAATEAATAAAEGSTEDDGSARSGIASGAILSYDEFVIREKQSTEQLLKGNRDVIYQQSNVAPYVLRLKEDLQFSMIVSTILFLISLILGCVFTIFMDLRRDRGIRMIAISELIGTVFAGGLTAFLLFLNPAKHLFIEPDYLYVFFKNHIDWMIRVLSVVTVFGLVMGMTLIGLYFSRRREKN